MTVELICAWIWPAVLTPSIRDAAIPLVNGGTNASTRLREAGEVESASQTYSRPLESKPMPEGTAN